MSNYLNKNFYINFFTIIIIFSLDRISKFYVISQNEKNFTPDLKLISSLPYRALLITSHDDEYDFISRYFAPSVGIDEDPVCGSAHCRLIPYWAKKLKKDTMVAYQASKRGGVIKCRNLDNRVMISGQAITTHSH